MQPSQGCPSSHQETCGACRVGCSSRSLMTSGRSRPSSPSAVWRIGESHFIGVRGRNGVGREKVEVDHEWLGRRECAAIDVEYVEYLRARKSIGSPAQ